MREEEEKWGKKENEKRRITKGIPWELFTLPPFVISSLYPFHPLTFSPFCNLLSPFFYTLPSIFPFLSLPLFSTITKNFCNFLFFLSPFLFLTTSSNFTLFSPSVSFQLFDFLNKKARLFFY